MEMTENRGFGLFMRQPELMLPRNWPLNLRKQIKCLLYRNTHKRSHITPRLFENMNRKEFRLTGSWMSYSAPFPGSEWSDTAYYLQPVSLNLMRV